MTGKDKVSQPLAWDDLDEKLNAKAAVDPELADLREENARLREALETVRLGDVYGKPYLGFISENGCWSVEWPADGLGILREWIAKRDAALKLARGE